MESEEPYASPDKAEESVETSKPLFWSRMVRYSIHFTILGIILTGLKVYVVVGQTRSQFAEDEDFDAVDAMTLELGTIVSSLGFAAVFLVVGIASIVVSLVMRHLEKKRRRT